MVVYTIALHTYFHDPEEFTIAYTRPVTMKEVIKEAVDRIGLSNCLKYGLIIKEVNLPLIFKALDILDYLSE